MANGAIGLRPPVPRLDAPSGMPLPVGGEVAAPGTPRFGDIIPLFGMPTWASAPPALRRTAAAVSGATFQSIRVSVVFLII